ncbi:MAG TPA: S8 family serine peptidase, partial [Anaerolineae bacterium]|nr:S8 family serine peptidase [Anaerolineae bacterium]
MTARTRPRWVALLAALCLLAAGTALAAGEQKTRPQAQPLLWTSLTHPLSSLDVDSTIPGAPASDVVQRIDPVLRKRLVQGAPGSRYHVLVEMEARTDLTQAPGGAGRGVLAAWVVSHLQSTAGRAQAGLLAELRTWVAEGHVVSFRPLWIYNAVAVEADAEVLWSLARLPEVRLVREDGYRHWTEPFSAIPDASGFVPDAGVQWNIARIRADQAWDAFGLDGAGVTIAIMDTGVDWQHPALIEKYRGYKPGGLVIHEGNWICTTDEGYLYPVDGNGHGTHVTGTAVGCFCQLKTEPFDHRKESHL